MSRARPAFIRTWASASGKIGQRRQLRALDTFIAREAHPPREMLFAKRTRGGDPGLARKNGGG